MNRFEQTRTPFKRSFPLFLLPSSTFVIILLLFLNGIHSVNDTTLAKQQESLETALTRSVAQCYAVEGIYPPSLEYLMEHYGISYDTDTFLVTYEFYGANLLPEITVLYKQK